MEKPYRVCFLGYKQLTDLARKVIDELSYEDTEIHLIDCNVETLPSVVDEALGRGYEVFIAGSANAAEFARYSQAHLSEIVIRDIDYLIAIKKALAIGRRPAITTYRFSRNINIELLSSLAGAEIGHIVYEDSAELYGAIKNSDYDVVIGASHANECASELQRKGVLLYAGEDTIRRSIARARTLTIELRKEQRYNEISRAIIRNSPLGIIVSDEEGRISLINQLAQTYTGIPANMARGRMLSELAPNLSPDALLNGDMQQIESYKILGGMRVRCIQNKLKVKESNIGVLTTLHIDNRNKKKEATVPGDDSAAARWRELIALSPKMRDAVALGRKYSGLELPLAIFGDLGAEKELFAECVHTGSSRAGQPLISINLAAISESDAGRHLLGSEDKYSPHVGLLEMANNGTVILRNLQHANMTVQDCLFDVIGRKQLSRTGGYDPVPVNIRFITLFNQPLDERSIRSDLLHKICTLRLDLPSLNERREDIPELFDKIISRESDRHFSIKEYQRAMEILCFYSWPGNMFELNAAADRLAAQLNEAAKVTPNALHHMMITAIGEARLLEDILKDCPGIRTGSAAPEELKRAVEKIKYFLGYNNSLIAEKLGMSRTSLWRTIKP